MNRNELLYIKHNVVSWILKNEVAFFLQKKFGAPSYSSPYVLLFCVSLILRGGLSPGL